MNPTVIRPSVSPKTITKVTRLFNGTIGDILGELLQNFFLDSRYVGFGLVPCRSQARERISAPGVRVRHGILIFYRVKKKGVLI